MAHTIILLETNLKFRKAQEKRAESETQVVKSHGNRGLRVLSKSVPTHGVLPTRSWYSQWPDLLQSLSHPIPAQTSRLLARGVLNRCPALGEENVVGAGDQIRTQEDLSKQEE